MSRYVYIYVYVCVLVYVCVFIYVLIWVWVYSCMRVLVCECVYVCVCVRVCVEWMGGKGSVHISYHLIFGFRGPPYLTQLSLLGQPPLPQKNHHSLSLSSRCISTHFHALFMCFIAFLVFFFTKILNTLSDITFIKKLTQIL